MITLHCMPDVDINSLQGSQPIWSHAAAAVAAAAVVHAAAASTDGDRRFLVEGAANTAAASLQRSAGQGATSRSGAANAGNVLVKGHCR